MRALRTWLCVATALAVPRAAEAWCGMAGEVKIAPNGGLFAPWSGLALRSGKRVIRLRQVERADEDFGFAFLYRPVRPLVPGRSYQIDSGHCDDADRPRPVVRAVREPDVSPPSWTGPVRIVSSRLLSTCGGPHGRVTFEVPVSDESDVAVKIELRHDGARGVSRERFLLEDGQVTIDVGGVFGSYQAAFCAEDAAGNVSCAERPISFVAPNRGPRITLVEWDDEVATSVVGAPPSPDEQMRATAVRGDEVDWLRVATTGGALSLLCCLGLAFGLARAGRRRAARMSS